MKPPSTLARFFTEAAEARRDAVNDCVWHPNWWAIETHTEADVEAMRIIDNYETETRER